MPIADHTAIDLKYTYKILEGVQPSLP